jgi:hypothetical protein
MAVSCPGLLQTASDITGAYYTYLHQYDFNAELHKDIKYVGAHNI